MRVAVSQTLCFFACVLTSLRGCHGRSLDINRLAQPHYAEDKAFLVPRDALRTCSAPTPMLNGLSRRDREVIDGLNATYHGSGLIRRVMRLPDGDDEASMNKFIINEIARSKAVVFKNKAKNDVNTGVWQDWSEGATSAGVRELCGCTTMVILSRMSYFVGHYWENIAFSPDEAYWGSVKSDQKAFAETVESAIMQGKGGQFSQTHPRLAAARPYFSGDDVRAFLIVPHMNIHEDTRGYRWQWDKMKEVVGRSLPGLDPTTHGDRWKEIVYYKHDREDKILETTAAGSVLIKYDPDHPAGSQQKEIDPLGGTEDAV